jgi:hypothetical protein
MVLSDPYENGLIKRVPVLVKIMTNQISSWRPQEMAQKTTLNLRCPVNQELLHCTFSFPVAVVVTIFLKEQFMEQFAASSIECMVGPRFWRSFEEWVRSSRSMLFMRCHGYAISIIAIMLDKFGPPFVFRIYFFCWIYFFFYPENF